MTSALGDSYITWEDLLWGSYGATVLFERGSMEGRRDAVSQAGQGSKIGSFTYYMVLARDSSAFFGG